MFSLSVPHILRLSFRVAPSGVCSNHPFFHKKSGTPTCLDIFCSFDIHKFKVISACFVRLFHNCSGHSLSAQQKPLMRWFLNDWITRSAAFTQLLWGSTNCHLHSFVFKKCFQWLRCLIVRHVQQRSMAAGLHFVEYFLHCRNNCLIFEITYFFCFNKIVVIIILM